MPLYNTYTEHIYSDLYIHKNLVHLLSCARVNVKSSSKMPMIIWLSSSH